MGRIALFLADKLPLLAQQRPQPEPLTERESKVLAVLESSGASFFDALHQAVGGGYPGETIDALWSLVWRGLITNDSLHALRAYIARPETARNQRRVQTGMVFRSRKTTPPTAQGRWSMVPVRGMVSLVPKGEGPGAPADLSPTELPAAMPQLEMRGPGGPRDSRSGDRRYGPSQTEASHALALQLLSRYGVLMRESVAAENVPGGFQRGVRRAEGA